jgi:2'-phosphotransferase
MSRNHIHFSTGLPEDKQGIISGMRNDSELLIYIDIKKSLEDGGVLWWMSNNGVVLTEGDENGILGTKYWKKVEGRKQNIGLLWEGGEQVRELPLSLRTKKPPHGKGPRAPNMKERTVKLDGEGKGKFVKPPGGLISNEPEEGSGP